MRLDFVITELDVGGAERCLASLALHAHRQGHQVRVIALGPRPIVGRDMLPAMLEQAGIETHFLGGDSSWKLPWVVLRLRKLVRHDPPQAAQSFLFHANVAAALAYPSWNVPLFGGVRVAEPRRWRYAMGRWAAKNMTKVVCVSNAVKAWCMRCERLPESLLEVIPNGVDPKPTPPFTMEPLQGLRGAPFLLFVGRLDVQKGIDELIDRLPSLLNKCPSWHVVIVGEGPWRTRVEAAIATPDFQDRVHYVGWQPHPRRWMAQAGMLVLPTRYEGMPNVVLEAMAEGCPVVTMNVEGVEEVLGELSRDQAVAAGDFDAWERQVIGLASDPDRRQQLAQANAARVQKEFALDTLLDRYLQLYQDAVAPR